MLKNTLKLVISLIMMAGTLSVLAIPTAHGAETVTYELNLNISDAASSDSSFNYKSKSVMRSAVNPSGQPVFTPVNRPSAHWNTANAKRCVTLKAYPNAKKIKRLHKQPSIFTFKKGSKALTMFRKAAMSDKVVKRLKRGRVRLSASCFWLRPGAGFPDSVEDITGNVRGVGSSVKGNKPMLFEVAKATSRRPGESTAALVPIRRGQDFDGDGVIDDGDCGNKKPAVIEFPEGTYEYNDTDSYWWKDMGDVIARVRVGGSATIRQGKCVMTLNYDFFAQGTADYSVIVKGKTSVEAHGEVVKIVSKQSAHADASANAAASVKASLKAQFTGCDNQPEEPEVPKPTLDDITLVNFVTVGQSIELTLNGTVANGHTGELFCKALNGGTITPSTKLQMVPSGRVTAKVTYVAPGEIPGELKDAGGNVIVPEGHDMTECELRQNDNQSVTIRTAVGPGKFEIRGIPPESE